MSFQDWNRRRFLKLTAHSGAYAALSQFLGCSSFRSRPSTSSDEKSSRYAVFSQAASKLRAISPQTQDQLVVSPDLQYSIIAKMGDSVGNGLLFGSDNDFLAYFPLAGTTDGLLWVNHESIDPYFLNQRSLKRLPTKAEALQEQKMVGGSVIRVVRRDGVWTRIDDARFSRRIDATTMIPFAAGRTVLSAKVARGTLANCSGGVTPWNTVLSAEEDYENFYGEVLFSERFSTRKYEKSSRLGWEHHIKLPPEHYGWIVEVNPFSGKAEKHISLGRFAHEGAEVVALDDGRVVVYMAEDRLNGSIFKFISSRPNDLTTGTLYVADRSKGRWIPLVWSHNPVLKKEFRDETDCLTWASRAAKLLGASDWDRPEDMQWLPDQGAVIVALTYNDHNQNPFGSLVKIIEAGKKPDALEFEIENLVLGGEASGLACPDNLALDPGGQLWVTTDRPASKLRHDQYARYGNNGLFVWNQGELRQMVSAPIEAELTGPCFHPDGSTLFLSVQHPGEYSSRIEEWTSRWPHHSSSDAPPQSAVVAIEIKLSQS